METYYGLVKGSKPITLCLRCSLTLSPTKSTGEPCNELQNGHCRSFQQAYNFVLGCTRILGCRLATSAGHWTERWEDSLLKETGPYLTGQVAVREAAVRASGCWRLGNISLTRDQRGTQENGHWGQLWAWGQQARCTVNQPPKFESLL